MPQPAPCELDREMADTGEPGPCEPLIRMPRAAGMRRRHQARQAAQLPAIANPPTPELVGEDGGTPRRDAAQADQLLRRGSCGTIAESTFVGRPRLDPFGFDGLQQSPHQQEPSAHAGWQGLARPVGQRRQACRKRAVQAQAHPVQGEQRMNPIARPRPLALEGRTAATRMPGILHRRRRHLHHLPHGAERSIRVQAQRHA